MIPGSSAVEHTVVSRPVGGSNPSSGANLFVVALCGAAVLNLAWVIFLAWLLYRLVF